MGTGAIGLPLLRALCESSKDQVAAVLTQPDRPAGRGQAVASGPVKDMAEACGVPVLQPESLRGVEIRRQLRALSPDAAVVMAYGLILPRTILTLPRLGCLNVHASLLPRHRGASPVQAAILAGDAESGLTVISMDEGVDTGDILLQRAIPLSPDETGESLHDRLAALAPEVMLETLDLLRSGTSPRIPQDARDATFTRKLERADGEIDWAMSAEELERRVRAFHRWPGTWTVTPAVHGSRVLKVFPPVGVETGEGKGPGVVEALGADGVAVATGRGRLVLRDVQLEGRRRMPAAELLRGFPLGAGDMLGSRQPS